MKADSLPMVTWREIACGRVKGLTVKIRQTAGTPSIALTRGFKWSLALPVGPLAVSSALTVSCQNAA